MRGNFSHWAIALLIFFNIAVLGYGLVLKYQVATQENESFHLNKAAVRCVEEFSGSLNIANTVEGAKKLVSLEYSVNGTADERTVQPNDGSYNIAVSGQPTDNEVWTLRAYYYDKTGQLSETAEQFESVGCDQKISADLELK